MSQIGRSSSGGVPLWERSLSDDQLIQAFKQEAAEVRRAVTGDLMKVSLQIWDKTLHFPMRHLDVDYPCHNAVRTTSDKQMRGGSAFWGIRCQKHDKCIKKWTYTALQLLFNPGFAFRLQKMGNPSSWRDSTWTLACSCMSLESMELSIYCKKEEK